MILQIIVAATLTVATCLGFHGHSSSPHTCLSRQRLLVSQSSTTKQTIYTIDCPDTDPDRLRVVVEKHIKTASTYASCKPIAAHTAAAFEMLQVQLREQSRDPVTTALPTNDTSKRRLILDSGCGTGRSCLLLGTLYPNHTIVGVDQSIARLSRNLQQPVRSTNNTATTCAATVQQVASNVWLVRAELVDFWRCCMREQWQIEQHYLLYPNPYPKKARLKLRWYAHPALSILLQLQADQIVLRSNWKQYLVEFRDAVHYADACYASLGKDDEQGSQHDDAVQNFAGPYIVDGERQPILEQNGGERVAWTNFEEKYFKAGEPTFELTVQRAPTNWDTSTDAIKH